MQPPTPSIHGATTEAFELPSSGAAPCADAPRERFTALYHKHFDYVWNTARRLGVPPQHLADVTHDVFVTVFRKLDEYDPARPAKPWLLAITFRVTRNHQRLAGYRNELLTKDGESTVDSVDPQPAADERLGAAQERALVRDALDALDDDRRAVLVLHDIEERPAAEIAAMCEIPVKTVYSRLHSARELFTAAVRRIRLRRGTP